MKHFLVAILIFSIVGSSIFLFQQPSYADDLSVSQNQLSFVLLGPYGQKIAYSGVELSDNSGYTTLRLSLFDDLAQSITREDNTDFCGEGGGDYHLGYYFKVRGSSTESGRLSEKAFECFTTIDLINLVKIPTSWEQNDLLIYCSQTGKTPEIIQNDLAISSFLFSEMSDTYMACTIRNIDTQETLLYGFPYGNVELEKDISPFYNETSENPFTITSGYTLSSDIKLNDSNEMMEFRRDISPNDPDVFYMSYFNEVEKPYFIISTNSNAVTYNKYLNLANPRFSTSSILDKNSNSIFAKIFENKTIYGYQTPEERINSYSVGDISFSSQNDRELNPMYVIRYRGFGDISNTCLKTLSYHNARDSLLDQSQTKVVCFPDTIMLQASNLDSNILGEDLGFTLYKNIITKANGDGEYVFSPFSFMYSFNLYGVLRNQDNLLLPINDFPTPLPQPTEPPSSSSSSGGGGSNTQVESTSDTEANPDYGGGGACVGC